MKIAVIGSVKFSEDILIKLIELKQNIVGVCTKSSSKFNSDHEDLSKICNSYNIPVIQTKDINQKIVVDWFRVRVPDVVFCCGWSQIIKRPMLNVPTYGIIGYHPTLLPANRGRHPIIWTLALGLKETGSTFFLMDDKIDEGAIISQVKINVSSDDNAQSLYNKITLVACNQLQGILSGLKDNKILITKQNINSSNFWRKRTDLDGMIDWRMSSETIYNLVRALSKPYPGAYALGKNQSKIIIWKVQVNNDNHTNFEPGKIIDITNDNLIVKTSDSSIRIINANYNLRHIIKNKYEYFSDISTS